MKNEENEQYKLYVDAATLSVLGKPIAAGPLFQNNPKLKGIISLWVHVETLN